MSKTVKLIFVLSVIIGVPGLLLAQTDQFGVVDTVYADLEKINETSWSITLNITNDEELEGLSIPLKMTAGMTPVVADSAIYTGGRVENFSYTGFRADTAIQCITLGMLANLGPSRNFLPRGNGRLVTVFISSLNGNPIEKLSIDTTTTQPNNYLMLVANQTQYNQEGVDTIPREDRKRLEILPAFVVRFSNSN